MAVYLRGIRDEQTGQFAQNFAKEATRISWRSEHAAHTSYSERKLRHIFGRDSFCTKIMRSI